MFDPLPQEARFYTISSSYSPQVPYHLPHHCPDSLCTVYTPNYNFFNSHYIFLTFPKTHSCAGVPTLNFLASPHLPSLPFSESLYPHHNYDTFSACHG